MSIIKLNTTLSKAEKKQKALDSLKAQLSNRASFALQELDRANKEAIRYINSNPLFTAEEAWAVLGEDGKAFLEGSIDTSTFIATQAAKNGVPYTPPGLPEGLTLTANEDGTVTPSRNEEE